MMYSKTLSDTPTSSCCFVLASYSGSCSGAVFRRLGLVIFAHVQQHVAVTAPEHKIGFAVTFLHTSATGCEEIDWVWAHEKVIYTARYRAAVLLVSESSFAFEAVASQSACSAECMVCDQRLSRACDYTLGNALGCLSCYFCYCCCC